MKPILPVVLLLPMLAAGCMPETPPPPAPEMPPPMAGASCGAGRYAALIGQSGVRLEADLKNVAFALFIFALGVIAVRRVAIAIGRACIRLLVT